MKKNARNRSIDTIFVLIIFSTFAFSVLMVLTLGAGVYKNISDISRELENERTALSYVRTKVRNLDNAEAVHVAPFSGVPALHIDENIDGTEYTTVIYAYNGWLCELFCEATVMLLPEDGIRVTKIDDLRFEEQDFGTIRVLTGDMSLLLTPRSGVSMRSGGGAG